MSLFSAENYELENCFGTELRELLKTTRLRRERGFIQHGQTSVLLHSAAVAFYSYKLYSVIWRIDGRRRRELVRGALLHDYFLYDWHSTPNEKGLHGIYHPVTALENARRDTSLSPGEAEIIRRHMFPLTLTPPKTRSAWVVCLVDKLCSVYEVFKLHPYVRLESYVSACMCD